MFTFELGFFFTLCKNLANPRSDYNVASMPSIGNIYSLTNLLWTADKPIALHASPLLSLPIYCFSLTPPATSFLPLSLPHTAFCPTPLPPTPPPGLAPEHIDFAVYLITAHNLFISPLPKRAAAVTQHTTRGLVQGYLSWDLAVRVRIKIWRKDSRDNNPSIAQKSSCWTCYAQILRKNDKSFDVWWRFFFYTCELHFIPLGLPLSKNMLVKVKCVVLTVRSKGANAQSSVLLNVFVAWRLLRINNSEPDVLCLLFTTFLSSTWPCLSILCVLSKIENVQELESRGDQQILVRWNPDNICMLICIIANMKV